jgi:serine/threonine protein kinase
MVCPACGAENEAVAQVCFTCRAVLRVITQGTVIGARYEVESVLGRGGMGTVYRARDRVLDEPIALKVLRPEIAATEEMAERFRTEIRLARKVSHPNVCRIHEYAEEGNLRYISMELVQGATLREILKGEGRLAAERAGDVAIQVADGLAAIHRVGIVHRDVKSLNIMVDGEGTVKVMDFGIAKRLPAEGEGVTTDYVVGSPEYMSPEQARGRRVDPRSDIYSLGIVLYEMLTGDVPFRGDTAVATLLMHIEQPPPLHGRDGHELPAAMLPVLRRSLAKDPGARYASAQEMAEALRHTREATAPPAFPDRAAIGRRRPRAAPVVATATAAVLALALALGLRWRHGSQGASPSVEPPVTVASVEPRAPTEPTPEPSVSGDLRPSTPPPRLRPSPRPSPTPAATPPSEAPAVPPAVTTLPSMPPSTMPQAAEPPSPAPATDPREAAKGFLTVTAIPWADVRVDGELVGQTPLRVSLSAGSHAVLLTHPDYEPFPRRVRIPADGAFRLVLDWATEGVRRRQ